MKVGQALLDMFCPIGAEIRTTNKNYNPNTLFNGTGCKSTWDLTTMAGKISVGYDPNDTDFSEIGKTGGEKLHKLTIAEMPSHDHYHGCGNLWNWGSGGDRFLIGSANGYTLGTPDGHITGGDLSHNNLQPYIVKYIWTRTA